MGDDAAVSNLHHIVDAALARALTLAANAGRWELVASIAIELADRRQRTEGTRVDADACSISDNSSRICPRSGNR